MLRRIATVVGAGFILYAVVSIFRGRLYDSDAGWIEQRHRPLAFWLSAFAMMALGLFIIGVGQRWTVVQRLFELTGNRL